MNRTTITGRLTADPELRTIGETTVCEMRLAVKGMGKGNEVGYIDVVTYGGGAKACAEYLTKGWLVAVDGRIEFRQWTKDDTTRHDYRIVGNVEFLTAPKDAEAPEPATAGVGAGSASGDDDIPF